MILADASGSGGLIIRGDGNSGDLTIRNPLRSEISDVSGLVNVLMGFLLPVALLIIFLMFIYAGYLFLSSEGSAEKVKQAQGVIVSSIIGLVLLFFAFFIIRLISSIFGFQGGILPSQ